MRKSVKRAVVIGTALALTAGGATAAYAAWKVSGTGSTYAKAGTAVELTTSVATTEGALLYPGVIADSTVKVTNKNPFPVDVTSVSWAGAKNAVASNVLRGEHCNNTGVYFGDFTSGKGQSASDSVAVNLHLGAGETKTFTVAKSVRMTNASENGCQGATFTIPVSLTGVSADS